MNPDMQIDSPVVCRLVRRALHRVLLRFISIVACSLVWLSAMSQSQALTTATMLPSGDAIELSGRGAQGAFKTTIPVHRSGNVRYFSAGVGLEERQADYPPFPLKLIFVAGPKAYLSKVGVTITNDSGTVRVDIPSDHVTGPWLFVDLPAGTYAVEAVSQGERLQREGVRVSVGRTRTVYLRWPRGPELY